MRSGCHHSAWGLLFHNPFFWSCVGKDGLKLREVCREFKDEIPEHASILAIFNAKRCRKVALFRLLPLSVNDVVRMRSPAVFLDAFDIAIRKTGGFENCMAIMRDRGWRCWCELGLKRRAVKDRVDGLIRDSGFDGVVDVHNAVYQSAITTRRRIDRVAVWRHACSFEGLMPWEQYNPFESVDGVRRSRNLHAAVEFQKLLHALRDAVGFWYKGIHGDVFRVETFIRSVRESTSYPFGSVVQYQMISNGVLILGLITFYVWVSPVVLVSGQVLL